LTLAALLLAPSLALAAELGRLTLLSGVGEPLRAEIELVNVTPGETAVLTARIPPPEVFWRSSIEPAPGLRTVTAAVERRAQGRYVVALRSTEPMLEPFMDLLVELNSGAGRALREYTFLLEEPSYRAPARAAAPEQRAPVAVPSDTVAQPEPGEAPAAARGAEYRVKAGDTLASIARAHMLFGATFDQMVVAIYRANESAFVSRNMNLLRTGALLAIPDEVAVLENEPAEAQRIVFEHRAAFDAYRKRLAASVARSAAPASAAGSQQAAGRVTMQEGAGDAAKAAPDQLKLSQSEQSKGGGAAREDDIVSMQRALTEAQERITLLEKSLQDVRALLELKSQQLAQAQTSAQAAAGSGAGGTGAAELPPQESSPTAAAVQSPVAPRESSLTGMVVRALAWMSVGAAVVLLPIGAFVWFRGRTEQRRENMIRQATGMHRRERPERKERKHRRARQAVADERFA
jgi:pilus assembly protein FimV